VLRFCDDMRLSFILAIVTLLAEPIGGFQNDNTPGMCFVCSVRFGSAHSSLSADLLLATCA